MTKNLNISVANIIWIIGVIFAAGIAYSQITYLEREIDETKLLYQEKLEVLERRLEKKIKLIDENRDEIQQVKIELAKGDCSGTGS